MLTFASIISPVEEADFLAHSLGWTSRHADGHSDKFESLLPWEDLNFFLSRGGHNLTRLSITKGGETIPSQDYSRIGITNTPHIHLSRLRSLLGDGAVLRIDCAEDSFRSVAALADTVQQKLETPVSATVCVRQSAGPSCVAQRRQQDALTLQVSGGMSWLTHRPIQHSPDVPSLSGPIDEKSYWTECVIREGGWLYIPRGWWECERAVAGISLTVTLSFRPPTGMDILGRLVDHLGVLEAMNRPCPRFADAAVQGRYLTMLQLELVDACSEPGLLLGFFKDLRAMADPVRELGLPYSLVEDPLVIQKDVGITSLVSYPDSVVEAADREGVEVFFDGKRLSLGPEGATLLRFLSARPSVSIRQIIAQRTDEGAEIDPLAGIAELWNGGLIALCHSDHHTSMKPTGQS